MKAARTLLHILTLLVLLAMQAATVRPARATPTAQNGNQEWIAYTDGYNVWLIHPDGSGKMQLTTNSDYLDRYYNLKWSPDGLHIAFAFTNFTQIGTGLTYRHEIAWASPVDMSIEGRITDTNGGFDWYTDSNKILYDKPYFRDESTWDDNGGFLFSTYDGLYTYDLETSTSALTISPPLNTPLLNPNFSPDGNWLSIQEPVRYFDSPYKQTIIRFENNYQPVFEMKIYYDDIAWHPDSSFFAFSNGFVLGACTRSYIQIISSEGEEHSSIPLEGSCDDSNPLWSPTGDYIVFERSYHDQFTNPDDFEEYVVSSDSTGSNQKRIALGTPVEFSPDGTRLFVYYHGYNPADSISVPRTYIIDLNTGEQVDIDPGIGLEGEAAWQPVLSPAKSLISEKNRLIRELEYPPYKTYISPDLTKEIKAFNEESAKELIQQLRTKPSAIPDKQILALSRYVKQEQTTLSTLTDYSLLSNDISDAMVDVAGITASFIELTGKPGFLDQELFRQDIIQTQQHAFTALLWNVKNEEIRDLLITGNKIATDFYNVAQGDTEALAKLLFDPSIRFILAEYNLQGYTGKIQPDLDTGARSVLLEDASNAWEVSGTDKSAETYLADIKDTSHTISSQTHSQYIEITRGLDRYAVLQDVVDYLAMTQVPFAKFAQTFSRGLQVITDIVATGALLNQMDCITRLSEEIGERAFQPSGYMLTCESVRSGQIAPKSSVSVNTLSQTTSQSMADALSQYQSSLQGINEAQLQADAEKRQAAYITLSSAQAEFMRVTDRAFQELDQHVEDINSEDEVYKLALSLLELERETINLELLAGFAKQEPQQPELQDELKASIAMVDPMITTIQPSFPAPNQPQTEATLEPATSQTPSRSFLLIGGLALSLLGLTLTITTRYRMRK